MHQQLIAPCYFIPGLEDEIKQFEELGAYSHSSQLGELTNINPDAKGKLEKSSRLRLIELRAEVNRIEKAKEEYVAAHPEHKKLVYAGKRRNDGEGGSGQPKAEPAVRQVFGKDGLPIHPDRSVYYHPTMNPYGMPPPGMPYMERRMVFPSFRVS